MRIVARLHAYPTAHNAGAEWTAHALLRALVARGHTCTVWLSEWAEPRQPYDLDGVHVIPDGPGTHQPYQRAVRGADAVITHLESVPGGAAIARGWGRPLIVLCHNTFPATFRGVGSGTTALAVYNSDWMAAAAADHYAVNPGLARPEREIVVRPPVAAADYRATPGECITMINLYRPKGAELFWELARRLPERPFLGVRGSYGDQLVEKLPNVEVLNNIPGDRMAAEVYSRTRVLLMPSEYESWGRTGVEAIASGIPVIAHPTPGLSESLADGGIFIDRADAAAWVAELQRLDDPAEYKSASARAKRRSKALDPADDLGRWCQMVESLPTR